MSSPTGDGADAKKQHYFSDERWDAAVDLLLRRTVYGTLVGAAAAIVILRECNSAALCICTAVLHPRAASSLPPVQALHIVQLGIPLPHLCPLPLHEGDPAAQRSACQAPLPASDHPPSAPLPLLRLFAARVRACVRACVQVRRRPGRLR